MFSFLSPTDLILWPLMKKIIPFLAVILSLVVISCNKTATFESAALDEYMPMEVGKFIHYRLDSFRIEEFGQKETIVKYEAKDVVDAAMTDNLGRPGFRLIRYLRDTLSNNESDWTPINTYMVVPTPQTMEVIENNFRFQKLKLPIKEGFNWKGNSYISAYSSDPNWDFRYYDDWDYTYENVDAPFTIFGCESIENTITVNQRDELIGIPEDANAYSERNYSVEVYAKGVGMVFKDFIHWEHQPPNGGNPAYKIGYGVKLLMIDHN